MKDILLGVEQTSTAPLLSLFGKGLLYKKKSDFYAVVNEPCVSNVIVARTARKVFVEELRLELYSKGFW